MDRVTLWQVLPPVEVLTDWRALRLIPEYDEDASDEGRFRQV